MKKSIFSLLVLVLLCWHGLIANAATGTTESNIDLASVLASLFWDQTNNTGSTESNTTNDTQAWTSSTENSQQMNINSWWTGSMESLQQIFTESNIESNPETSLESAPIDNNYVYSSWELINRTPMLAGFVWTWEIANFITPAMYIGTPFSNNQIYIGENNPFASFLTGNPTNYAECLSHEAYLSFGLGDLVEDTDITELKAIAKACAKEYYGSYFSGKSYTTREEFLMMMFTLFEEDQVGFQWEFTDDGDYIPSSNDGSVTSYSYVDSKAWYASYLKLADNLVILPLDETTWKIGKEITDTEAIDLLSLYVAYRMSFDGESFDKGIITTEKMKYNFSFVNDHEITIKIQ